MEDLNIPPQTYIPKIRNKSILGIASRLSAKPPVKYTVGLSIITDNTIDGMGSVAYLNQVSIMAKGAPNVVGSYFVTADALDTNGYYEVQDGYGYFEKQYQQS